jgi:Flp pilus assembly protein protease CpaA
MLTPLAVTTSFIALLVASYTDIRTREVPDWLNFSLIAAAVGTRLLLTVIAWDISYVVHGLLGLGIGVSLGYLMFYTGQWGGGDSKLLMGLGAMLGFQLSFDSLFVSLLVNILFIGAAYGFAWSLVMAIHNWNAFGRKFQEYTSKRLFSTARIATLAVTGLALSASILTHEFAYRLLFLVMAVTVFVLLYLWVFVKAVEEVCMLKWIPTSKLTEGDWIAKDINFKGKYVTGPKDLGISKKNIARLRRLKVRKVLIKEGIPFVPSFLIAFLLTLALGNVVLLVF